MKILLWSTSKFCLPANPWPKNEHPVTKKNAIAFTKRKFCWRRPEQGNSWDQYGDSSSAASASASAKEGGRGTYSMSEKQSGWGPWLPENASSKQVQSAQPYRIQSANRGASSWADWACKVRNSQEEYRVSSSDTWYASAGGTHAWDTNWDSESSGVSISRPSLPIQILKMT